jgi:hypothetical protein
MSLLKFMNLRSNWKYSVEASPQQCASAFITAFSGRGGLFAKADWSVSRAGTGAVAVYNGRRGLGALTGAGEGRQGAEMQSAIGSQVKFEIDGSRDGRTLCSMRVGSRGSTLGFTSDARFFRPYLRAVDSELRRLDPSVEAS